MKVSVAMATYQGERWIGEQLRSILDQTRRPDELVLVDDASSDRTVEIARGMLQGQRIAHRVEVNPANVGPARNFGRALGRTTGQVVFLADQDDRWRQDKVERVLGVFERPGVDAVCTDAVIVTDDPTLATTRLWQHTGLRRRARAFGRDPLDVLLRGPVVTGATLAFRGRHRDLLLPVSEHGWHDHWFSLLLAAVGTVVAVDEPLVEYRLHGDNAAGVPADRWQDRLATRRADDEVVTRQLAFVADARHRLAEHGVPHEVLARFDGASAHLAHRATLPAAWPARAWQVAAGFRGYARYSQGLRAAAYDLLYGG